jgi:outer membrane protein OmpA-like peptidoglycan-associated protein
MAVDLLDLAKGYFTPSTISRIAETIGETPAATQKAIEVAVPTLAGVACNQASTPSGASNLFSLLGPSKLDPGLLTNFTNLLGSATGADTLMRSGSTLIEGLLGNNAGGITNLIANAAGIGGPSASSLLSIIAPLFFGLLGKHAAAQNLSTSGLSGLLSSHRDTIQRMAPPGLASILGAGSMSNVCGAPEPAARPIAYQEPVKAKGFPWAWAVPLVLLIGLVPLYRSCSAKNALASINLPCGTVLSLERDSFNYNLANFMLKGSDSELPKRIVFDHFNFDTASKQLTPDSTPTFTNLVAIVKCYPNMQIQLDGYTDNTGDPAANKTLSLDRANTVKSLLVNAGVDAGRISTEGWGQEKPIASNDTEDGRAKNRRTELVVTKR